MIVALAPPPYGASIRNRQTKLRESPWSGSGTIYPDLEQSLPHLLRGLRAHAERPCRPASAHDANARVRFLVQPPNRQATFNIRDGKQAQPVPECAPMPISKSRSLKVLMSVIERSLAGLSRREWGAISIEAGRRAGLPEPDIAALRRHLEDEWALRRGEERSNLWSRQGPG